MALDASIYGQVGQGVKSVADYDNAANQVQVNKLQLLAGQQQYAQGQQAMTDSNALRDATKQFGTDPTQNRLLLAGTGNYQALSAYDKAQVDNAKTRSDINLNGSKMGEQDALAQSHVLDTSIKNHDYHVQQLGAITSPADVPAWIDQGVKSGVFTPEQAQAGSQRFQAALQQPGGFDAWKQQALQGGVSATDQLKQQQAALLAGNVQAGENARASMAQAGENSRAALGRQQALTIAGIGPGGALSDDGERTAQAIAAGQLQPPTGMALTNPKNQRILGRVMEINPAYDSTTVTAKKKAASDFTTGTLGNSMRSFAVAGQHLDQLGNLVDALGNGNVQVVNQLGNKFSEQTGNPAPTNFDAAKDVVSKEVVKAIVAGGGGVAEREELSKLMSNAKSPAQLKGVITQYRNLMGAQHDALLQQRRAAGLPDSTLPSYTDANGSASAPAASTVPPDIAAILAKHGAN